MNIGSFLLSVFETFVIIFMGAGLLFAGASCLYYVIGTIRHIKDILR